MADRRGQAEGSNSFDGRSGQARLILQLRDSLAYERIEWKCNAGFLGRCGERSHPRGVIVYVDAKTKKWAHVAIEFSSSTPETRYYNLDTGCYANSNHWAPSQWTYSVYCQGERA